MIFEENPNESDSASQVYLRKCFLRRGINDSELLCLRNKRRLIWLGTEQSRRMLGLIKRNIQGPFRSLHPL